jgi:tetratricopeptide (TPR) repeat protein
MRRALGLAVAIAALVFLVGIAFTLNPGSVDVHFPGDSVFRVPLGLLLVGTLVSGVLLAVVAVAIQQLNRRFSSWGNRRRAKREAQVVEWNESAADLAWSGEIERSRATFKKAWRLDPQNKEAALALAASYIDTGEFGAAKQALDAALAEAPNDPDLRYALADALHRGGDLGEAIRMLETIRVQYPHAPRLLASLRDLYAEVGQWQEAGDVQEIFLRQVTNSEGVQAERERLHRLRYRRAIQSDDPAARIAGLESILQEDRGYRPAIDSLAETLISCDRAGEAQKLYEKAFKREPRLDLAARLLQLQETSSGRQRIIGLLNKHADGLDGDMVRVLRARAALADDKLDVAEQELEAAADRDTPAVQRCWADLYHKRGETEPAWNALRSAADAADR